MSDVSRLNAAKRTLRIQSITDHLTNLPNRKGLFEYLESLRLAAAQDKSAIVFLDLDNFKWVNDTHGHDAGDRLLREAAVRLKECISHKDYLARLGGDEFAIILRDMHDYNNAEVVAQRILRHVGRVFEIGNIRTHVGCSIGIAFFGIHSSEPEELLRYADLAMYKSKQEGRNRISFYSGDLGNRALKRETMTEKIRRGLSDGNFRLHLQPIIDLATMRVAGAEALLRLQCPEEGMISPSEIISVAEETGMINRVGDWVMMQGLSLIRDQFDANENRKFYIAINLSPRQLDAANMGLLVQRLEAAPELAKFLTVEITETALLQNEDTASSFFARIRATGARVALDDFGTGYSSLSHLGRYPVDVIKIDRSFTRDLGSQSPETRRNLALVKATTTMAHELGVTIVAEGIEDPATVNILRDLGIEYGQGFLFSKALPQQAFFSWARTFGAEGLRPVPNETPSSSGIVAA
jgi:diguanylate cyclase (GGDEF)-like protein